MHTTTVEYYYYNVCIILYDTREYIIICTSSYAHNSDMHTVYTHGPFQSML